MKGHFNYQKSKIQKKKFRNFKKPKLYFRALDWN